MRNSLFGHLALRFASHPENLATEALCFVLRGSPVASAALEGLFASLGVEAPPNLIWSTQAAGDDGSQPDLVGSDTDGRQPIIIEAKFWAGLTGNQPVTYLQRVPRGGALAFVAPARRLDLLWRELVRRCNDAGVAAREKPTASSEVRRARVVDDRQLLVMSWRALIDALMAKLELAGEQHSTRDLDQLRGLCERMDEEAFLPLTSEELTASALGRVHEFGRIVDDVAAQLCAEGIASTKGLRASGGNGYYGRSMLLNGVGVFLACDTRKWRAYAQTPLWISVFGPDWNKSNPGAVRRALAPLEHVSPPRMFMARDGFPTVPLHLPLGEERSVVVAAVLRQVLDVAALIRPLAVGGTPSGPPPDFDQDD
ncbi:MAG: hypothetical protein R3B72_18705 [Polyangiaceae bacterium]